MNRPDRFDEMAESYCNNKNDDWIHLQSSALACAFRKIAAEERAKVWREAAEAIEQNEYTHGGHLIVDAIISKVFQEKAKAGEGK